MTQQLTWDSWFMNLAATAASKSKDESTKVGAVIADRAHRIRSIGFNGFPQRVADNPEAYSKAYPGVNEQVALSSMGLRKERPLKYRFSEHAERNAIYSAARMGTALDGCVMYINGLPPCSDCARAIIQSGITEVVHLEAVIPERWYADCMTAEAMLKEAGVVIRVIPVIP